MKFMVFFRIGDFVFIFGHITQLKQAVYRTIVDEKS